MNKPKNYHENCNPGTIHLVDEKDNCSGCDYARFIEKQLKKITEETK